MALAAAALEGVQAMDGASQAAGRLRKGMGLAKRSIVPSLTIVGPGADLAGAIYGSIATRLGPGGYNPNDVTAVDARIVQAYVDFFTWAAPYGTSSADRAAAATYLSFFTRLQPAMSPAHGLRL